MHSKWTSSGTGQVGDDERRYLRSLSPAERSRWIDSLCGEGSSIDVIEAEVVGLDELGRDFELNCEVENYGIQVGEHIGVYELGWNGPWMPALPELRDEQRRHAVVFDYPRVDALELTTAGPRGFVLEDPPPPTKIENRFGSYELRIERVDAGAKVSRALAIFPLVVKTDEYDELRGFLDEVARLDRTTLRFRRDRSQP